MGVDLLDIAFRVEKNLGVELSVPDLQARFHEHRPPDLSVSELVEVLMHSGRCGKCRYDLRGHGTVGVCPECGVAFGPLDEARVLEVVRRAVVEALRVNPDQVRPDALLIRDLGMA